MLGPIYTELSFGDDDDLVPQRLSPFRVANAVRTEDREDKVRGEQTILKLHSGGF